MKSKEFFLRLWILLTLLPAMTACEDLFTDPEYTDPRERITGEWFCSESDTYKKSAGDQYRTKIFIDPYDSTRVRIYNFYNLDDNIFAMAVMKGNSLNLPGQMLEGGFTISGNGVITNNDDRINWEYNVDDGSGMNMKVTAVYTRL